MYIGFESGNVDTLDIQNKGLPPNITNILDCTYWFSSTDIHDYMSLLRKCATKSVHVAQLGWFDSLLIEGKYMKKAIAQPQQQSVYH